MKTSHECIPCFVRQAAEAVEMAAVDNARKERLLRMILREIAACDWSVMPVSVSQRMHRLIRDETAVDDPYALLKQKMNRIAQTLLPSLIEEILRQPDPRDAVVRLAAAGNLLDAGAKTRMDPDDLQEHLHKIWTMPLHGSVQALFEAAERAEKILFLADNAGEIVFDRLLIEALPLHKITVAVRGAPVINDATMEDAKIAGITALAPVIDNGSDAPGTLLTECSEKFRKVFEAADLVIAKGQGNYETLSESAKNVFFVLTVKCPAVAADIGAPLGALVVKERKGKENEDSDTGSRWGIVHAFRAL